MACVDKEALKKRQIAFFQQRLASYEEWRKTLERAHDALLCARVSDLVDEAALDAAIEAGLEREALRKAAFPLAVQVHERISSELATDAEKIGSYVPERTRRKIDDLLCRPGIVPEKLLRQLFEQEAVEELLRDVLYDALKEFNEKVNPFFAEWGLAGIIKKVPGLGLVSRSMETVRAEFDKRLDPEIRKFLQGFSRRALRKMADAAVAQRDDKKSIALRRAIAAWLWEQPVNEIAGRKDVERSKLVREIAFDIVEHACSLDGVRKRRKRMISELLREFGDLTLGDAMRSVGITERPDFDALARSTWPAAKAVLFGPAMSDRVAAMFDEFFAQDSE